MLLLYLLAAGLAKPTYVNILLQLPDAFYFVWIYHSKLKRSNQSPAVPKIRSSRKGDMMNVFVSE